VRDGKLVQEILKEKNHQRWRRIIKIRRTVIRRWVRIRRIGIVIRRIRG
jgi:hypothetical protein